MSDKPSVISVRKCFANYESLTVGTLSSATCILHPKGEICLMQLVSIYGHYGALLRESKALVQLRCRQLV